MEHANTLKSATLAAAAVLRVLAPNTSREDQPIMQTAYAPRVPPVGKAEERTELRAQRHIQTGIAKTAWMQKLSICCQHQTYRNAPSVPI